MSSDIRHITVDCRDHYALAQFWAAVLGFVDPPDGNDPDDPESILVDPDGRQPSVLFVPVPEGKAVKNRVHLDLQPQDRSRDEEVARVTALGATLVADHRTADDRGWVTLADPEGNEFCVERSRAERTGDD